MMKSKNIGKDLMRLKQKKKREEGRGKRDKFYRKKGDNIILMDNRGTPIQPLNPQQTTKGTSSLKIVLFLFGGAKMVISGHAMFGVRSCLLE